MNATIIHTSSREADNALRIARVAAAGRIAAERAAAAGREAKRVAHATRVATSWVEDVRAAGAVEVGFKVCTEDAKFRFRVAVGEAASSLVHYWGEDVEAWGIRADGEHVAEVW